MFDDADIDAAVEGESPRRSLQLYTVLMVIDSGAIACKFRSSGQTCVCANRIFVQSGVYAEFASRLAEKVAAFKVGDPLDSSTCVLSSQRKSQFCLSPSTFPARMDPSFMQKPLRR